MKTAHENKCLLGKFFRYRNGYGGLDNGWWLYIEVIKILDSGSVVTLEFQRTTHEEISIKQRKRFPDFLTPDREEITSKEFKTEFNKITTKLGI